MCKAHRVFIFGSTMFSCIRPERLWYNSISPYGNLEMYITGYVFIERLVGWRQWPVLWGTYKCFTHFGRPSFDSGFCQGLAMRLSITSKSKVPNWGGCVVCGVTLEICLPVPRGALAKSKVGETLAWRHHHDLIFSTPNVYTKCSYCMNMSDIYCTVHFVQEEGQHQRLHTAGLGQGGQ